LDSQRKKILVWTFGGDDPNGDYCRIVVSFVEWAGVSGDRMETRVVTRPLSSFCVMNFHYDDIYRSKMLSTHRSHSDPICS
jgi:hypothetical protein